MHEKFATKTIVVVQSRKKLQSCGSAAVKAAMVPSFTNAIAAKEEEAYVLVLLLGFSQNTW